MIRHKAALGVSTRTYWSYAFIATLLFMEPLQVTQEYRTLTETPDTTYRCLVGSYDFTVASTFQMNSEGKMAQSLEWDV